MYDNWMRVKNERKRETRHVREGKINEKDKDDITYIFKK